MRSVPHARPQRLTTWTGQDLNHLCPFASIPEDPRVNAANGSLDQTDAFRRDPKFLTSSQGEVGTRLITAFPPFLLFSLASPLSIPQAELSFSPLSPPRMIFLKSKSDHVTHLFKSPAATPHALSCSTRRPPPCVPLSLHFICS